MTIWEKIKKIFSLITKIFSVITNNNKYIEIKNTSTIERDLNDFGEYQMKNINKEFRTKKICQAIVNCFETSSIQGHYDKVTLMNGDTGGLTYGRSQTTINSGNLYILLDMYIREPNANRNIINSLLPFIEEIKNKNPELSKKETQKFKVLKNILESAGQDPVMIKVQDEFFDKEYWMPAYNMCKKMQLQYPLSYAVVYDSYIHGSFFRVRRMFPEVPPNKGGDEKKWTIAYVYARSNWLSNHKNKLLNITNYRMESFKKMIDENNWNLDLPIIAHDILINQDDIFDS